MSEKRPVSSTEERGGSHPKIHPLDWPRVAGAQGDVERAMRSTLDKRRNRAALYLSVMTLCILTAVWIYRPSDSQSTAPEVKLMAREQLLDDGSLVDLDETAELVIDFTAETRRVMLKNGKAHFSVAKNPSRPFIVVADGVEVRAVGTAFVVETGGRTNVLVTEGKVSVTAKGANSIKALPLEMGQRITIIHTAESTVLGEVKTVSPAELDKEVTWRVPRIDLDSTALAQVLPLFEKYSRTRLVVEDPKIGDLKLSGSIRANNVSALLMILRSSYGIDARNRADGSVLLIRKNQGYIK